MGIRIDMTVFIRAMAGLAVLFALTACGDDASEVISGEIKVAPALASEIPRNPLLVIEARSKGGGNPNGPPGGGGRAAGPESEVSAEVLSGTARPQGGGQVVRSDSGHGEALRRRTQRGHGQAFRAGRKLDHELRGRARKGHHPRQKGADQAGGCPETAAAACGGTARVRSGPGLRREVDLGDDHGLPIARPGPERGRDLRDCSARRSQRGSAAGCQAVEEYRVFR